MSPYLLFKNTSVFQSDANTPSLMAISRSYPAFLQKKKNPEAEESTPSPTVLDYIPTCAEESSATEQTRITVVGCVIITKCSFTITISPSLEYGFQTSALTSVMILTQFLSMQSNL